MAAILKRVFHHNVDVPIRFLWTQKEPWYQAKSIALFLGISNLPRALSMCPPDSAKTLYELSLIYGGPSRYGRTIPPGLNRLRTTTSVCPLLQPVCRGFSMN